MSFKNIARSTTYIQTNKSFRNCLQFLKSATIQQQIISDKYDGICLSTILCTNIKNENVAARRSHNKMDDRKNVAEQQHRKSKMSLNKNIAYMEKQCGETKMSFLSCDIFLRYFCLAIFSPFENMVL